MKLSVDQLADQQERARAFDRVLLRANLSWADVAQAHRSGSGGELRQAGGREVLGLNPTDAERLVAA